MDLGTCMFLLFSVKLSCAGSFIACETRTILLLLVVLSEINVQATVDNTELKLMKNSRGLENNEDEK